MDNRNEILVHRIIIYSGTFTYIPPYYFSGLNDIFPLLPRDLGLLRRTLGNEALANWDTLDE